MYDIAMEMYNIGIVRGNQTSRRTNRKFIHKQISAMGGRALGFCANWQTVSTSFPGSIIQCKSNSVFLRIDHRQIRLQVASSLMVEGL